MLVSHAGAELAESPRVMFRAFFLSLLNQVLPVLGIYCLAVPLVGDTAWYWFAIIVPFATLVSLVPISIDGVAPTTANLANGTYNMWKTLYFVTGPGISKAARDFLRFIRSPAGAEILARTGNVVVPDAS